MQKKELLIFDLDGTLVDTRPQTLNCINYALSQINEKPISYNILSNVIGLTLEDTFKSVLAQTKWSLIDQCVNLYKSYQLDHSDKAFSEIALFPTVDETLKNLSSHCLTVATSKPVWLAHQILSLMGIRSYFSLIVGIDSVTRNKPSPDMIYLILSKIPDAAQAIVIGDSVADIQAGKKAKVLTCAVEYGYGSKKKLEEEHPDFMISQFCDLLSVLASNT